MKGHQPRRPAWTCTVDGDDWPCVAVRKLLLYHYAEDHEGAAFHLLHLMALARENAADSLGVAPAKLYRRFVGWTLPDGTRCRVCDRVGHDVLPGLPPRLFPCDGRAITPVRDPNDVAILDSSKSSTNRHAIHIGLKCGAVGSGQ